MGSVDNLVSRRDWITAAAALAGVAVTAAPAAAQYKLFPLRHSGLDHISITLPDSKAAAIWYGKIFDPQVFHEQTGVQRYYVRLGAAYIAFGPQATAAPYIDHIAAGVIDFVEADFGKPEIKSQVTAAGLTAPPGVLPIIPDPDGLRLQLVNATHGIFDTIISAGRVITDPAVVTPMGLDHIMIAVSDLEKSSEHYQKILGKETSSDKNRVWFQLADTRLGLEPVAAGAKPGFSHYCVRIAGFNRDRTTERLQKLGVQTEPGAEKSTLRFRDLHNLAVELVAG